MRIPLLVLAITLLFSACDSNENTGPVEIDQVLFKPDQVRIYASESILIGFDEEGNEVERREDRDTFIVEIVRQPEPVPGFENVIQMDTRFPGFPDDVASRWYIQNDSQLVDVAFRNGGGLFASLKTGSRDLMHPFLPGAELLVAGPDMITVNDPPRVVLEFPMELGKSWVSLVTDNFLITAEVLEPEDVSVPAGTYSCQVIRTFNGYINGNPEELTHYFADDGLVKRTRRQDIPEYRDSQNNPTGPGLFESTLELIEIRE